MRFHFSLRWLLVFVSVICIVLWFFWARPRQFAAQRRAAGRSLIHERDQRYLNVCFDELARERLITVLGDSRLTHWDSVNWLVTPDRHTIISYGHDGALIIWNRDDGSIRHGQYDVACAAYAVDVKKVFWTDSSAHLHVTELDENQWISQPLEKQLPPGRRPRLVVAPNGAYLVHHYTGKPLTIWRTEPFAQVASIELPDLAHPFVCTRDSKSVIAAGASVILEIDLAAGEIAATVPLPPLRDEGGAVANAVTFSPDGKTLYLGDAAGRVLEFDWTTKTFREEFLSDQTSIRDLGAREGSLIVSGRGVTQFHWFGEPRRLFMHSLPFPPVAAFATGEAQAVALYNGRIESVESETFRRMTGGPRVDATCFAFSPDSTFIALAGRDGQIVIRETAQWKLVRSWKAHDSPVWRLLWNPNGRQLASCGDNEITFWDSDSGEETRTLPLWGTYRAKAISFDANGGRAVIPDRIARKIGVYDTQSFQQVGAVSSRPSSLRVGMVLSADSKQLYVGANGTNATLWDIQRDAAIRTFPARTGADVSLDLSPDEKTLYTASNRDVNAFDVATGKTLWTLKAHTELIRDLACHPGAPIVASVANDGTLVITEAQTGTLIERLRLGPIRGELRQVDFSPDGSLLAVGMNNGAVVVLESPVLD